ncbi:MAG: hypothetical protein ACKO04_13535, partial [Actinomycetes bacterium]
MTVSRSKKLVAGLALAGTAGVGGLAVAALNPVGAVGAASNPSTTTVAGRQGAAQDTERGPRDGRGPQQALEEVLDSLVQDGTLTRAQADKVTSALEAKVKEQRDERKSNRDARRQEFLSTAAAAIGISEADLESQLEEGTTLADVATANNVDPNKVVDALVAKMNARIDAAVAEGKLTAEQGEQRKARTKERVTDMVNNGPRQGGPGGRHGGPGGRRGGPDMDGPGMDAPDGQFAFVVIVLANYTGVHNQCADFTIAATVLATYTYPYIRCVDFAT